MKRVSLYQFEDINIKVSLDIYFNEKNQLIFEGYDIGKKVLKLKGDSDYEYYYTIEADEVQKIATLLNVDGNNQEDILHAIRTQFGGNEAYSRFGDFMRENDITFGQFTWR